MAFPTFDALLNFVSSAVATAPSPATSGTSLIVTAATGASFPATPFDAVVWPTGAQPTASNAEIVRVTGISTDTFTITRGPQTGNDTGGVNRSIVIGDNIARCVNAKDILDTQQAVHLGAYMASAVTTSSATANAATALSFSATNSAVYQFHAVMQQHKSNTTTTGVMYGVTVPTGATAFYEVLANTIRVSGASSVALQTASLGVSTAAGTFLGPTGATTQTVPVEIRGMVTIATTSGNVSIQFGVQTAGVTCSVDRGSITAFRVA